MNEKMFNPLNRHILIEKIEEQKSTKEESLVLVPDDYKIKNSLYGLYKVLNFAPDCEKIEEHHVNCNIVVNETMVEEMTIGDETYYLILENYVYGFC